MNKIIKGTVFEKRFFRKDNDVCEHIKFSSGVQVLRTTDFNKKGNEVYDNKNVPEGFFEDWSEIDIATFAYLIGRKHESSKKQ